MIHAWFWQDCIDGPLSFNLFIKDLVLYLNEMFSDN